MVFGLQQFGLISLEGNVVEDLNRNVERRILPAQVFEQGELALIDVAERRRRRAELTRTVPTAPLDEWEPNYLAGSKQSNRQCFTT